MAYYKHKVDQEQRERERGYRQFISEASMPVMIIQDGRIQYLNKLALNLYKTHYIEDVLMLPYLNFVEEQDKLCVGDLLQEFDDNGHGFESVSIAMQDVHGQSFCVKISGSAIMFNRKSSLQITLLDNSELVNVRKRADALLNVLIALGQPYFISDKRFNIKTVARHPLFDDVDIEEDIVKHLPKSLLSSHTGDSVTFNEKHTNKEFQAIKIKNAAGDIFEILFFPKM